MQEAGACAACLADGMRMHSMTGRLLHAYRLIVGRQISDRMPQQVCWECAALLNKFYLFHRKCERAYLLLQDIHSTQKEIAYHGVVPEIDRQRHNLTSVYSIAQIVKENIEAKARSGRKNCPKLSASEPKKTADIKGMFANVKSDGDNNLNQSLSDFGDSDDNELLSNCKKPERKCAKGRSKHEEINGKKVKRVRKRLSNNTDLKVAEVSMTMEEAKEAYMLRMNSVNLETHPYKCTICFKAFRGKEAHNKHQMRHDTTRGPYECEVCRRRFATAEARSFHIANHLKKYACNICSEVTYTRNAAENHHRLHAKQETVKANKKRKCVRVATKAEDFGAVEIVLSQEQQMDAVRERQNARGFTSARFKCMLCYKAFNEQKTYGNHMVQHSPASGELECDICKLRYNTRLKIFKHITNNHMKRYTCQLCTHVCYNRSFALNHYRWHKGVVYKCNICGATFDKKTSHRSHLRVKHPSEHVCGACAEPFVSSSGLQQHVNRMHATKPDGKAIEASGPYCGACDVQFASAAAWTRHILISPKHKHEKHTIVNGCQYCGVTLPTPAELKAHYVAQHRRHKRTFKPSPHELFPAPCAQCEETMPSAGKYWQHFRQRHPGKDFPLTRSSFICEHCGNWFKYKSALDAHRQTHSERRRCAECPRRFARADAAAEAAHARAHAADAAGHACDACGRRFAYRRSLTNHFRKHTAEKPHCCKWCGKTFAYDCNLRRHLLAAHSEPAPEPISYT